MAHEEPHMPGVEYPAERFGECVCRLDDPGDVLEFDFPEGTPLLESKVSDGNVAGAGGGSIIIDDFDGGVIVFPKSGRSGLGKT